MHKNSQNIARDNALILETLVIPRRTRSRSPSSGSQGQKLNNSEGNISRTTASAGGNPNASYKYKSENNGKTDNKRKTARYRRATASRSTREYLVDSGATFQILNKSLLTNEELRTARKLDTAVKLQTANGIITATHQAKVKVMELDLTL